MRAVIRARIGDHLEGFSQRQALREAERAEQRPADREYARRYLVEARAGMPPKNSPLFKKAVQD